MQYFVGDIPTDTLLCALYNLTIAKPDTTEQTDGLSPIIARSFLESNPETYHPIQSFDQPYTSPIVRVDEVYGTPIRCTFGLPDLDTTEFDRVHGKHKGLLGILVARYTPESIADQIRTIAQTLSNHLDGATIEIETGVAAPLSSHDRGHDILGTISLLVMITRLVDQGPNILRSMQMPLAIPVQNDPDRMTITRQEDVDAFFAQIARMSRGVAVDVMANPSLN